MTAHVSAREKASYADANGTEAMGQSHAPRRGDDADSAFVRLSKYERRTGWTSQHVS